MDLPAVTRGTRAVKFGIELLLAAAFAMPAVAAQYGLELKPETSRIEWTLVDPIHTVHGTFRLERGQIVFDSESGTASGQVVVDVASGESGGGTRDRRMHANVLESAKYPEAVFAPHRIEGHLAVPGTADVRVPGTFTIHGAAHEITMNVRAVISADRIHATMEFDIPYVEWGMKDPGNFLIKVSKTVRVSIDTTGLLMKR